MFHIPKWLCLLFCCIKTSSGPLVPEAPSQNRTEVTLEPPADFTHKVEVVGCYCEYQGKLLFLLRNSQKAQGNTWCIPGGKIEKGETPTDAVIREVMEETGMILMADSLNYCRKVYVRFPEKDIILHLFRINLNEMPKRLDLALDENVAWRWATIQQALEMRLIPGGKETLLLAYRQ